MSDVQEPGLEYLPAEIEQHEMDQLQREYDAGEYPPRIATTQEIVQDIRDGYARDVDPAVTRAQQEAIAEWARSTARTVDLDLPAADTAERLRARLDLLRDQQDWARDRQADPILSDFTSTEADEYEEHLRVAQQPTVRYVTPPVGQQYRPDADYPSMVVANTRVAPAAVDDPWMNPPPAADTARFETELAIAQQVAANQVRAQQQADAEAAERLPSAALGQYIAPTRNAPARTPHR